MKEDTQPPVALPAGKGALTSTGKTIGDVMDGILIEPRKAIALLMLLASFAFLAILVMWAANHVFHLQTSEIEVGNGNSHVVLQQIEGSSGDGKYIVMVSPQGWQNTKIPIEPGD